MGLGPLVTDIIVTFCLAASLLYRYGNLMRHHIIVTVAVFIAWFFSFLIIFVLPLDVSATVFRQCIQDNTDINGTVANSSHPDIKTCEEPWSNVPENVFPDLWRIVYWTSQCLTWLILPIMQSYSRAGEFTWKGKIKSAIIDNTIYYGTYLFICSILLIYLALQPSVSLDWQKLKAIASSASNTWGLFLLVILLGYALVEVPRNLWNASKRGHSLTYAYFRAATLSVNKSDAEDAVDDILESLKAVHSVVPPVHPLYDSVQTILRKVPAERWDRINRRPPPDDANQQIPSEKSLIRLHKQVIKALQTAHRTECQWHMLVDKVLLLEDVAENQNSHDCRFKHSFPPQRSKLMQAIYDPTIEWYWHCVIYSYVLKLAAILCGILSAMVVWSELTFFNKEPVLTLFARFLSLATVHYDYFTIEVLSSLTIAYMCFCAYSTVLKIRVLNHYYIAPHHQTDEFSLIFSGMMLCRLTPPMCLNFLGLIHMDSHILKSHSTENPTKKYVETYYTHVMGHMDVIAIISDGFNIYFPMLMLGFCLATYFSLGSRILSVLGIDQFIDEEIRTDLVMEGRELITRERAKRKRMEESASRRREYQDRFVSGAASRYRTRNNGDSDNGLRDESDASARAGLLRAAEPLDYYVVAGTEELRSSGQPREEQSRTDQRGSAPLYQADSSGRLPYPPRGLFDDV